MNKRYIYQAQNDRRIIDSSFRQQVLYTVNQVETIYWGLVQAYEDVQAKERALDRAPRWPATTASSWKSAPWLRWTCSMPTRRWHRTSSRSSVLKAALNYQQQIIKQAIARNLNDPALSAAAVIPTDRVSVEEIPEEKQPVEALVQEAFQQRPELEQAVLTLRNDEITLKGARNALLPQVDVFGVFGGAGIAGTVNPNCNCSFYRAEPARRFRRPAMERRSRTRSTTRLRTRDGIQCQYSYRQQVCAVGAGAIADGVSPG